jgi:hypothetical protein
MRKKLLSAVCAGTLVAAAIGGTVAAAGNGPSVCQDDVPGQFISFLARQFGLSGISNPGLADDPGTAYIPDGIGCNPTSA